MFSPVAQVICLIILRVRDTVHEGERNILILERRRRFLFAVTIVLIAFPALGEVGVTRFAENARIPGEVTRMESTREWRWTLYETLVMGVRLADDGQTLTWWAIRPDLPQKTKSRGEREQAVADFQARGPSLDNITLWELENPDYINHMYDPFWDGGEPSVVDGPRLHEIPREILEEVCAVVGADQSVWPPPPDTIPSATTPDSAEAGPGKPTGQQEIPAAFAGPADGIPLAVRLPDAPDNLSGIPWNSSEGKGTGGVNMQTPTNNTRPTSGGQLLAVPVGLRGWKTRKRQSPWIPPYKPAPPVAGELEHLEKLFKAHAGLARSVRGHIFHVYHYGKATENRLMELYGSTLAGVLHKENDMRDLIAVLADARQAAKQCGTQGMSVDSDIIWRFAAAKADFPELIREMFVRAPALGERYVKLAHLGVRLLCFEDDFFRSLIAEYAPGLEALVQTNQDAELLVDLLKRTAQNGNVHAEALLKVLPKTRKAMGFKNSADVFGFYLSLMKKGTYLFGIDEPSWLHELKRKRENMGGTFDKNKVLANLERFNHLHEFAKPWLSSPQAGNRITAAFEKMYQHHFGYSDLQGDMEGQIPEVLGICSPLVTSLEEFLRLCKAVPQLIENLPRDGESTPLGWTHSFDTGDLKQRARVCRNLDQLLSEKPTAEIEKEYKLSHPEPANAKKPKKKGLGKRGG